jgi:serine/threonine-protein kinase
VLADRYEIVRLLGAGGMGRVYEAVQLSMHRRVALKVLRPDLRQQGSEAGREIDRFRREAVALSRLKHPHTVQVFDHGETGDGAPFLVMELLEGRSLHDVLRSDGRLDPPRVVRLGVQACKALAEAHAQGLVHRDLKPSNLFLARLHGEDEWLKVVDFGLVRWLTGSDGTLTSGSDAIVGTPAFMSPEQARGQPVDCRTDIYSLGVTLYYCLSGRTPFTADSPLGLLMKHVQEQPPPLALGADDEGVRPLHAAVMRCLEKAPADRPAGADELRALLEEAALPPGGGKPRKREPGKARTGPAGPTSIGTGRQATTLRSWTRAAWGPCRRRRLAAVIGVGILVVAGAGAIYSGPGLSLRLRWAAERIRQAGGDDERVAAWHQGRRLAGSASPAASCEIDLAMIEGMADAPHGSPEACTRAGVPEVLASATSSCRDLDDRKRLLVRGTRVSYACRCASLEAIESAATEALGAGLPLDADLAEPFQRLGRCLYNRVLQRQVTGGEESTRTLRRSLTWAGNALAALDVDPVGADRTLLRLKALVDSANALKMLERFAEAEARLRDAMRLVRERGDRLPRTDFDLYSSYVLFDLGVLLTDWGSEAEAGEAETSLRQALEAATQRALPDRAFADKVRGQLGELYLGLGRYPEAVEVLEEALAGRRDRLSSGSPEDRPQRAGELAGSVSFLALARDRCPRDGRSPCRRFETDAAGILGDLEYALAWTPAEEFADAVPLFARSLLLAAVGDASGARSAFDAAAEALGGQKRKDRVAGMAQAAADALETMPGSPDIPWQIRARAISARLLLEHADHIHLFSRCGPCLERIRAEALEAVDDVRQRCIAAGEPSDCGGLEVLATRVRAFGIAEGGSR